MVAPVIEVADCTESGNNTASTSWDISHPDASTGDLLIWCVAWDDSTACTDLTAPSGANGETISTIVGPTADSGTLVRGKCFYTVATGSWTAGTRTFTPAASEQWTAVVIRVPAGEFDGTTPIGAADSEGTTGTTSTPTTCTFTAGSSDGGGRLVSVFATDVDDCDGTMTGWTSLVSRDRGACAIDVSVRSAATTNSESITGATGYTLPAAAGQVALAFIVRQPPIFASVGAAAISGAGPTVKVETAVNTGGGGPAPLLALGLNLTVAAVEIPAPVGTVAVLGYAATLVQAHLAVPAEATLAVAGLAPEAIQAHLATPAQAGLAADGLAPSSGSGTLLPAGSVTISGLTPVLGVGVAVEAGALTAAGQAPTCDFGFAVGAAELTVSGAAPALDSAYLLQPPQAGLSIDGLVPSVGSGTLVPAGSAVFSGLAPELAFSAVQVPVGAIEVLAAGPTVTVETTADAGGGGPGPLLALGLNLYAVNTALPEQAALTVGGLAPTLGFGVAIDANGLVVSGLAPGFVAGGVFAPGSGALAVAGVVPAAITTGGGGGPGLLLALGLNLDGAKDCAPAVLSVTGCAPTLDFGSVPESGTLTVAGLAPALGLSVAAGAADLVASGAAPSLFRGDLSQPPQAQLAVSGLAPGSGFGVAVANAALTLAGLVPFPEDSSGSLSPVLGDEARLTLVGQQPTVIVGKRVTFPFATTAQSFAAGGPDFTAAQAWVNVGNPAGGLQTAVTGWGLTVADSWQLSTDWASLGIPANTIITAITQASAQSQSSAWTNVTSAALGAITLTPTAHAPVTLAAAKTFSAVEGWTTQAGIDASGLDIASGGSLTIRSPSTVVTPVGGAQPNVVLEQDNITFVVSYTSTKVVGTTLGAAEITGYAPTVVGLAAQLRQPAQASLAVVGAGPSVFVTAAATGGGGPGLLLGLALNLENEPLATAELVIAGYAPRIGEPIRLLGADYLYAEPATITATVQKISSGDTSPTRSPGAASLAVTGQAPTISAPENRWATVPARALSFTRYSPGALIAFTTQPGAGSITVAGRVAFGAESPNLEPGTATLAVAGLQPLVGLTVAAAPGEAALAATGAAPTFFAGHLAQPAAGSLTVTGLSYDSSALKTWRGSGSCQAQNASVSASFTITRRGTGVCQAQAAFLTNGTGTRIITGTGTCQAGPSSVTGDVYALLAAVQAGPATVVARVQIKPYQPPRAKRPERVNRYNVALKPRTRKRTRLLRRSPAGWVPPPPPPLVSSQVFRSVPVGSASFDGLAPDLDVGIPVPAGSASFSGSAPGNSFAVAVPAGSVSVGGLAPPAGGVRVSVWYEYYPGDTGPNPQPFPDGYNRARCWAYGGGGGGARYSAPPGGGGGGAYCYWEGSFPESVGWGFFWGVGQGGSGQAGVDGDAGMGGGTTFEIQFGTQVIAGGGFGGRASGTPGVGGPAQNGLININGTSGSGQSGGAGAGPLGGAGGVPNGGAGQALGGGGAGGSGGTNGGAGAGGYLLVEVWFEPP